KAGVGLDRTELCKAGDAVKVFQKLWPLDTPSQVGPTVFLAPRHPTVFKNTDLDHRRRVDDEGVLHEFREGGGLIFKLCPQLQAALRLYKPAPAQRSPISFNGPPCNPRQLFL